LIVDDTTVVWGGMQQHTSYLSRRLFVTMIHITV